MTTLVATSKTQPEVTRDMMHWDVFTLKQIREVDPKLSISGAFCLYGEDINGTRVFDKECVGVNDDDMNTTVITNAVANGKTPEEFMTEYSDCKTSITAEYLAGNIKDTALMVYLELAMARVAELKGQLMIDRVE